ncbi:33K [Simian adenovirus 8]|uniref:33K n=1 Tax=Simian adenovirus 8 TaxID=413258 RepID=A0A0M5L5L8_9ADEN|nr:33K [Simian adenovirus 8]ALE30298.1 33K [Simian adenovirus 8]
MAPKRQTQLLREKRSKKQERRLPQEPQTWDEESQDSWESQAATTEEEEDWEESLGETEEEAEGTDEEPAEEETPNAAAPLRSGAGSKTPRTPPAPPKLPPKKASRRWDAKPSAPAASVGKMMAGQRRQRGAYCSTRIFPTLYAIFQQSRGQRHELKIKNRTLRSLTRSCLYHRREDQLQRTLEDAEALFNKYCSATLQD